MKRFFYHLFRFTSALEYRRQRRLTPLGLGVFLAWILAGILGLDTNQSLTYQIFTFLFALLLIAIAFSLFFPVRFRASRSLPRFATVGVPFSYRILIHNLTNKTQNGLKLFENFADPRPSLTEFIKVSEPGENKRNFVDQFLGYYRWLWLISRKQNATFKPLDLPNLAPHTQTEISCEIIPLKRGILDFIGLTIARPDPLGLVYATHKIILPQSLLILPKLYTLPPIQLPGSRKYQSGGVALASSVGDSEEFRALRDYRPGDSLRKIHWKSWAKIGKPIVKEEQDEFFVRHALILDTFQSVPYSDILEEAIALAASFACEVQTQESLLDLMFVEDQAYCFTLGRSLSHTDKMLEILASVVACQDKTFDSITPLILERISLLSGCICILLTWDEARKQLIDYLASLGIQTLVLIVTDYLKEGFKSRSFKENDQESFLNLALPSVSLANPKSKIQNPKSSDDFDVNLSHNLTTQFKILKVGQIQEQLNSF